MSVLAFKDKHRLYATKQRQKQRAAGLCTHGTCKTRPSPRRTICEHHLVVMRERAKNRREGFMVDGMCKGCGKRRPFIYRRTCLVCKPHSRLVAHLIREGFAQYRQREASDFLKDWLFLLTSKDKQVVELCYGLDGSSPRKFSETAPIVGVCRERVRQRHDYAMVEIFDASGTLSLPDNLIPIARKLERAYGENLIKDTARRLFASAIAGGRVVRQPCEECGTPKADGHHDDYSKPLEVRWLCRSHHVSFHFPQQALPSALRRTV